MSSDSLDDFDSKFLARGIPPALAKATYDPFWYACCLRNGQVISFNEAYIYPGDRWVRLSRNKDFGETPDTGVYPIKGLSIPFDRGLDVRMEDIVWVADAPWGS